MPRLRSDSVEEPVQVLISSKEQEFTNIRDELSGLISKIRMGKVRMFKVILPEHSHRIHITTEIDRLLVKSSVLVALIGWDYSWWVNYEVGYAISNGIPILAYEYYKPRGVRRGTSRRQPATKHLAKMLRDAGIKIRGRKAEYRSEDDLISAVVEDLPELSARVINHYADINREVGKRV